MIDTQVPNAAVVPNGVAPNVGVNVAPPSNGNVAAEQGALAGFAKIQAELRAETITTTEVPFGRDGTIRIWTQVPAGWIFEGVDAENDPSAVRRAIVAAIVPEDLEKLYAAFKDGPNTGVTGTYLLGFMQNLDEFYSGGRPLAI